MCRVLKTLYVFFNSDNGRQGSSDLDVPSASLPPLRTWPECEVTRTRDGCSDGSGGGFNGACIGSGSRLWCVAMIVGANGGGGHNDIL